jgi:hypothetical protein
MVLQLVHSTRICDEKHELAAAQRGNARVIDKEEAVAERLIASLDELKSTAWSGTVEVNAP